jgi:DNA-binding XRE family transcriptional regulator
MSILKFVGNTPAASTLPTTVRISTPGPMDATALQQPQQQDDLDTLLAALGNADPAFAKLLTKASQDLAPLATTREGGVTLTSLRMEAGLTQTQLASMVGQKQSNISLYESGCRLDMKRTTMHEFCAALNCDMNTLDSALENSAQMLHQHTEAEEAGLQDGAGKMKDCA